MIEGKNPIVRHLLWVHVADSFILKKLAVGIRHLICRCPRCRFPLGDSLSVEEETIVEEIFELVPTCRLISYAFKEFASLKSGVGMVSALKHYEKWQEILREHFICNAEVGKRIYFYLAPTELKALASENDLTLHSLFNSVRWILFGGKGEIDVTYFEDFSRKTKRRNRKAPPPVLPILVCMTLAAEEMRTDNGVRSTNYYGRLAQLIDNDLNPKSFEVLKAQIRNKSAWFAELWKELDAWLSMAGSEFKGISTIRSVGGRKNIGYPISQVLVRKTDLDSLSEFLSMANRISSRENFENQLVLWVDQHKSQISKPLCEKLSLNSSYPLHDELVQALYEISKAGYSREYESHFVKIQELSATLDLDIKDLEFGIISKGKGENILLRKHGRKGDSLEFKFIDDEKGFKADATSLNSIPAWIFSKQSFFSTIEDGLNERYLWPGRWMLFFQQLSEVGPYELVRSIRSNAPTAILVPRSYSDRIRTLLDEMNLGEPLQEARFKNVVVFSNLKFTTRSTCAKFWDSCKLALERKSGKGYIKLDGGFLVETIGSKRVFTKGGEPTVIVSAQMAGGVPYLEVDEKDFFMGFRDQEFFFDLATFGLDEGIHRISVGEVEFLIATYSEAPPDILRTAVHLATPLSDRIALGQRQLSNLQSDRQDQTRPQIEETSLEREDERDPEPQTSANEAKSVEIANAMLIASAIEKQGSMSTAKSSRTDSQKTGAKTKCYKTFELLDDHSWRLLEKGTKNSGKAQRHQKQASLSTGKGRDFPTSVLYRAHLYDDHWELIPRNTEPIKVPREYEIPQIWREMKKNSWSMKIWENFIIGGNA